MPLKIFLVFYTASGGIAAVADMPNDMESCEFAANSRNEQILRDAKTDADIYVAECERHAKRPKVQIKIAAEERGFLESACHNIFGGPGQCHQLANGDVEILTTARDKQGNRVVSITKPDGRTLYGTYDRNNKLRIRKEKDLW